MMKFTILTSAALLAATAAVAQTTPGTPGTPGASGSMSGPSQPGTMPSTESMTRPGTDSATGSGAGSTTPGSAGNSSAMTEQMARQKLAGAGYGSVTNLKRNADGQWEAMTRNGGKQQRVTIGPDGSVTPNTQQ